MRTGAPSRLGALSSALTAAAMLAAAALVSAQQAAGRGPSPLGAWVLAASAAALVLQAHVQGGYARALREDAARRAAHPGSGGSPAGAPGPGKAHQ